MRDTRQVIKDYTTLREFAERIHESRYTIVTCNGCFDIIHAGHIDFLFEAASYGDILIVGMNSDKSVQGLKAGRPIQYERDRAEILSAIRFVGAVFIFDEPDPIEFIKAVKPQVHCNDFAYGEDCIEAPALKSVGGKLVLLPRTNPISTSEIITKIQMLP